MPLSPYNRFQAVLAIASLTRPSGQGWAQAQAVEWSCVDKMAPKRGTPGWIPSVLRHVVYPKVNPAAEAYLATYVPGISAPEPMAVPVSELGFGSHLKVRADGLELTVVEFFRRWREDQNLSVFLDVCVLADVPLRQVKDDIRLLWNVTTTPEDLQVYADLFIDRDLLRYGWAGYEAAYGAERANFVRGLMNQPHDYVRWKLGVPVSLDSTLIIDRLMSEAYYTERSLKAEMGDGMHLSKDMMARVKMERDTLFKALDRRLKIAESKSASNGQDAVVNKALETLAGLSLKYEEQSFPLVDELVHGVARPVAP